MTESADLQLNLKKKARRRLVGAVVFAGFAAVVLPMVMDEEPKVPVHDAQIRIPGQDQALLKPVELAARWSPATAAATPAPDAEEHEAATTAAALKLAVKPAVKPAHSPVVLRPTEKAGEKAGEKAPERKVVKPVEKAQEKNLEKKVAKTIEKVPEKAPEKPLAKKIEKSVEPAAAERLLLRKVDKPAGKAPVKKVEHPVEKPADKPAEKAADKPADKPSEDASKPPVDDPQAQHGATAPSASKLAEAAPAKTATRHVLVIGAFSNPENVKQVQARIGGLGVSTYTEVLPGGTKTRVRAGPFASRESAEKALEKLQRSGVSATLQ